MSNKTSFNIRGVIVFLGLLGGLFFMFLGFGYKPKVIKETENGLVIETGFTTTTKYFNGHSFLLFKEKWMTNHQERENYSISVLHDPDCQHVKCKK